MNKLISNYIELNTFEFFLSFHFDEYLNDPIVNLYEKLNQVQKNEIDIYLKETIDSENLSFKKVLKILKLIRNYIQHCGHLKKYEDKKIFLNLLELKYDIKLESKYQGDPSFEISDENYLSELIYDAKNEYEEYEEELDDVLDSILNMDMFLWNLNDINCPFEYLDSLLLIVDKILYTDNFVINLIAKIKIYFK